MAVHIPGGLERDAQAGKRPLAQYLPVVAGIAPADAHRPGLAARILEVPRHGEVVGGEHVVPGEGLRKSSRDVPGEVLRPRTDYAAVRSEPARCERRVLEFGDAHCDVEAFFDDVHAAVREAERKAYLRIAGSELGNARRDVQVTERCRQ